MAELSLNTTNMKECGNTIINLSIELNEALNALFIELENLEKNGVWVGAAATSFINSLIDEKRDYYDLKNSLFGFGNCLSEFSNRYENFLIENRK